MKTEYRVIHKNREDYEEEYSHIDKSKCEQQKNHLINKFKCPSNTYVIKGGFIPRQNFNL
jgi:hypothetical protein